MSRTRIWAIVEGNNHDVPFYEGLLRDGADVEKLELFRATDLGVEGSAAGGKSHALKLFRILEEVGGLQQENNATKVDVVFFLDRDDDEYQGALVDCQNVVYTHYSDVESEIVNNSDLQRASARAFSVARADIKRLIPENPASDLATIWSEWIILRLASGECGWSGARFAQESTINVQRYGEVDPLSRNSLNQQGLEHIVGWEPAIRRAREHWLVLSESGDGARLVKGKWLPSFITHIIVQGFGDERKLPKVSTAHFITACLSTVDFGVVWRRQYQSILSPVLDR